MFSTYLLTIYGITLMCFFSQAAYEGDPCLIRSKPGVCRRQDDCPHLERAFYEGGIRNEEIPLCGYTIKKEIICCPNEDLRQTTSKPSKPSRFGARILNRPSEIYCQELEEDPSESLEPHIFGGSKVSPGKYPHMVALGMRKIGNEAEYDYICGGSLIAKKFVLTAAHCVLNPNKLPVVALLGVVDLRDSKEGKIIPIKRRIAHDDYSSESLYHDIAVIELEREVELSAYISPICLNTLPSIPLPSTELFVAGWGKRENGSTNELYETKIKLKPSDICTQKYMDAGFRNKLRNGITDTQICAIDDGKDACTGDSGGPMFIVKDAKYLMYRQVGVVSLGIGCGADPAIYTRVSSHLDFIENIVWS